jgi:hypothetical protein
VRSIPAKKLRLIDCAKTRRLRRAQLLRDRRFRSLEIFSFVCAVGQGDGQREENEQQDWLHMSGFHRLRLIAKLLKYSGKEQTLTFADYLTDHVDVQSNSMG